MLGSLLLVSGLLLVQTENAPHSELEPQVRKLVRQLDDDQLTRREDAEKKLIKLGPDVLALLPKITTRTPAEVKDRLGRVRSALEKMAAVAIVKESLVTLKGEMTLQEALKIMEQQTQNKVVDFRGRFGQEQNDIKIKADFEKTPFWEALDQLLDQAGLTVYNFGGEEGALSIIARNDDQLNRSGRASYSGLFRFEGVRLEAVRDLRNPENQTLKLILDITWEPRISPIVLQQPFDELQAMGDGDKKLEIDDRRGKLEVPVQGGIAAVELQLPLVLPSRDIKTITSLKGKLIAVIPGRVETFEFDDLEKSRNVEQQRAGVKVVFEQLRKNSDIYEVRMRVHYDKAANALESHRGWVFNNDAYLIDPSGVRVENDGLELTRQEENAVGIAYKFVLDGPPKGYKFVYRTPAAIIKLPVEYELKNIDLP